MVNSMDNFIASAFIVCPVAWCLFCDGWLYGKYSGGQSNQFNPKTPSKQNTNGSLVIIEATIFCAKEMRSLRSAKRLWFYKKMELLGVVTES